MGKSVLFQMYVAMPLLGVALAKNFPPVYIPTPVCGLVNRTNFMPFIAVSFVFTEIFEPLEPIQIFCVGLGFVIVGQKKKPKS